MKKRLISLDFSDVGFRTALTHCLEKAKSRTRGYACFANVHMLVEAADDPEFARAVNQADWVFPDGMPIAKTLGMVYPNPVERVAGMDFIGPFLSACSQNGLRICVYGGSSDMHRIARVELPKRYPGIADWLFLCPPFGERPTELLNADIETMAAFEPHATLVILGCPRQEKFMSRHSDRIPGLLLGLGGALPTLLGMQKRAPEWIRKAMLEWAWRLVQEPGRLWKRYFYTNTRFMLLFFRLLIAPPPSWKSSL